MLNQSGITKTSYGTPKTLLANSTMRHAVSCIIANTGVIAGDGGKKIVKAGTPLKGDLTNPNTPFTTAGAGDTPIGVCQTDVDVTNGNANGSCLVFGFIRKSAMDSATQEAFAAVKAKLPLIVEVQ